MGLSPTVSRQGMWKTNLAPAASEELLFQEHRWARLPEKARHRLIRPRLARPSSFGPKVSFLCWFQMSARGMKKSMQKEWGWNIFMICLQINPRIILNTFSKIIKIQNIIQSLENIIFTTLNKFMKIN